MLQSDFQNSGKHYLLHKGIDIDFPQKFVKWIEHPCSIFWFKYYYSNNNISLPTEKPLISLKRISLDHLGLVRNRVFSVRPQAAESWLKMADINNSKKNCEFSSNLELILLFIWQNYYYYTSNTKTHFILRDCVVSKTW